MKCIIICYNPTYIELAVAKDLAEFLKSFSVAVFLTQHSNPEYKPLYLLQVEE